MMTRHKYAVIRDDAVEHQTSGYDTDDEWDRADTATDHYISGFTISDRDAWHAVPIDFDVDEHKDYYLLYVIYSTGDSFGHDEGAIEFVGLYEDEELAKRNANIIEAHNNTNQMSKRPRCHDEWNIELKKPNGDTWNLHTPWHGYFEQLTSVRVESIKPI